MKRVNTVLVLCLLLRIQDSWGQIDSALGFFPLNVGDVPQYRITNGSRCPGGGGIYYSMKRVVGDTLLPTGFWYKIIRGISDQYLRIDSSSGNVYQYIAWPQPHEDLIDSLRATSGSSFRRGSSLVRCIGLDTITVFNVRTVAKSFSIPVLPGGVTYKLAYGFGLIQSVSAGEEWCLPGLFYVYENIGYARINGIEYGTLVDVEEWLTLPPSSFSLSQNYPNPFNNQTTFAFTLQRAEHVTLRIFDLLGRELEAVVDRDMVAGTHRIQWSGEQLAGGTYFYRIQAGEIVRVMKLMLLK